MSLKKKLKGIWHFIWHDDSIASWVVNIILAFLIVRFILYPGIGLLMGTSFPIVAVVSGSMEHNGMNFDEWWKEKEEWYVERELDEESFRKYPFKNGFNKGDIMFLKGVKPKDIKVGDVVVYETIKHNNPIIHRVVEISDNDFITKGDNNFREDPDSVSPEQIKRTGKAVGRLPWLGWVKIIFVEALK
jgi:signal peptidase I